MARCLGFSVYPGGGTCIQSLFVTVPLCSRRALGVGDSDMPGFPGIYLHPGASALEPFPVQVLAAL